MGIEALPNSTVRAIGATQVLNDPASVIKELIDNALDAQSTNISVEVHSNTLDSIQVRDNGHGIPPEDRLLVAKPHCTSKISGEEDLAAIGGTSLGFRGEALASVAEMSGCLTISTRVEGEEVATALNINQQGEVTGQSRASLPVGTTVKINDFIKALSVRKQVALKNSEKTLARIKQLLKEYAFARPHVRLSLRVLKAKNDKGNWTYAPKAGGNAEDAAFKIVGAACASQCTWSVVEDRDYLLQAFLPNQDAETSKYSNIGPFISIDGRLISTARGTPKQFLKIFREVLKKSSSRADGVKDPFLFLSIKCPVASYDANVEPAKDDVLFEDPDVLIGLVRRLFEAVYPSPEAVVPVEPDQRAETSPPQPFVDRAARTYEDDLITSLEMAAQGRPAERDAEPWTPLPADDALPLPENQDSGLLPRRTFRSNMYGDDEEDMELIDDRPLSRHTEADLQELRQACRDVNVSNPWILAKMNSTARRRSASFDDDATLAGDEATPWRRHPDQPAASHQGDLLPTPGPSSPTKMGVIPLPSGSTPEHRSGNGVLIGSQSLPPPGASIPHPAADNAGHFKGTPSAQRRRPPGYDYEPRAQLNNLPSGTPLHMIPNASPERRQGPKKTKPRPPANAPFKPPAQDQTARDRVWFEHLENIDQPRAQRRLYQGRAYNNGLVVQGELGDLVDDPRPLTPPRRNRDVRDFFTPGDRHEQQMSIGGLIEGRQYSQQAQAGSASEQENVPQAGVGEPQQPPNRDRPAGFIRASELPLERFGPLKPDTGRTTKRRKTSERALRKISGNAAEQDETRNDQDNDIIEGRPASKRRRTTDLSASKSRRTKSSRLPLERVPKGQWTHNVVIKLSKSMCEISSIAGKIDEERSLLAWNETPLEAYDVFATAFEESEMQEITGQLSTLLASHVPDGEMAQDLGALVRGALAAHGEQMLEIDLQL